MIFVPVGSAGDSWGCDDVDPLWWRFFKPSAPLDDDEAIEIMVVIWSSDASCSVTWVAGLSTPLMLPKVTLAVIIWNNGISNSKKENCLHSYIYKPQYKWIPLIYSFKGLFTTFEALINVFIIQTFLCLLLINDDMCTKLINILLFMQSENFQVHLL